MARWNGNRLKSVTVTKHVTETRFSMLKKVMMAMMMFFLAQVGNSRPITNSEVEARHPHANIIYNRVCRCRNDYSRLVTEAKWGLEFSGSIVLNILFLLILPFYSLLLFYPIWTGIERIIIHFHIFEILNKGGQRSIDGNLLWSGRHYFQFQWD